MANGFLIAIAAGIGSAVLFVVVLGGGALGMPLLLLTPLPVVIVGLGWGTRTAGLSIVLGAVAAAFIVSAIFGAAGSPLVYASFGLGYLLFAGLPAAFYTHLMGLARPRDENDPSAGLEWYPLERLLAWIALGTAGAVIVAGALSGYSPETYTEPFAELLREMLAQTEGAEQPSDEEIEALARATVNFLPVSLGLFWTFVMAFNLWLGARIARRSGRLARPWEDVALNIQMPATLAVLFVVALFAMALPGILALAAGAIVGALGAAFLMLGFAVLHVTTRGSSARFLILSFAYGLSFLFTLPLIPIGFLGLAEPFMRLRSRRQGLPPPPPTRT